MLGQEQSVWNRIRDPYPVREKSRADRTQPFHSLTFYEHLRTLRAVLTGTFSALQDSGQEVRLDPGGALGL